jgi:hypothetical protein
MFRNANIAGGAANHLANWERNKFDKTSEAKTQAFPLLEYPG